jgi:hypothetical protein
MKILPVMQITYKTIRDCTNLFKGNKILMLYKLEIIKMRLSQDYYKMMEVSSFIKSKKLLLKKVVNLDSVKIYSLLKMSSINTLIYSVLKDK